MKTVLGFDSWTGGAHNFARLVPAFRRFGLELRLLHIGSWGGDVTSPKEETIGELPVRDVSWYGGRSLVEILELESPTAVLFLSNDVFAHRAFNRYCALRGIPTIHLYHGLVEIQSTVGDRMYKVNPITQLFYVLKRIPKALARVWPLYAQALHKTHASFHDWKRFASDIINLTMGKYIPVAAPDSRTNACAVYAEADVGHAMKKYGYSRADVHVVGNPDLSKFKLTDQLLGIAHSTARTPNDEIVYVDTGLIYAGMVFAGPADFLAHLTDLAKTLAVHGLKLATKLHPDHHRTNLPAEITKRGIRVIHDGEFVNALLKCRAAMVEPSTAALIPSLLGLPVLMVAFGKLQNQKYGKILMNYPRGALLTDATAVTSTIVHIEQETKLEVDSWIRTNSGPLPADEMPARVAEIVRRVSRH
jgi:hypothetical protein